MPGFRGAWTMQFLSWAGTYLVYKRKGNRFWSEQLTFSSMLITVIELNPQSLYAEYKIHFPVVWRFWRGGGDGDVLELNSGDDCTIYCEPLKCTL